MSITYHTQTQKWSTTFLTSLKDLWIEREKTTDGPKDGESRLKTLALEAAGELGIGGEQQSVEEQQ